MPYFILLNTMFHGLPLFVMTLILTFYSQCLEVTIDTVSSRRSLIFKCWRC